jgi:two-component system chemotaxis sensor kinase CheA
VNAKEEIDINVGRSYIKLAIMDDGRGLNLKEIKKRGIDKGLILSSETDRNLIANLIFESGLSTKTSVSDVSGRGVGMDAVRFNIQKLGGRCYAEVHSDLDISPWTLVIEIPIDYFVR